MSEERSGAEPRGQGPLAPDWAELAVLIRIFRASVIISTLAFLLLWFEIDLLGSFLSPETGDALAWHGYGALLLWPPAIEWLRVLLWVAVAIGMYTFSASARVLYLILYAYDLATVPLAGIGVYTAFGGFLGTVITFADGAILTLACLSPLRAKFR